ncbi:D-glycero-beta-D-manno-heptose 1-phosphate adenylyltransferase [Immundisolibacter sp.]|uniref:D-glycero-beta-D-manno-heptose 1-phosphate adenylyltransferase n=1 Tax=Immundisolibacter sp. TaxID=1934948 RepID=UPI00261739B4|nr:D-glycero-beta-D-manno-heptose 1-phosphate adenylyltransferase [Immundisolibacter sp.]MDD3650755.1 D-glycero-beta-D-manno-heptose 1-phosphate adenylyltransferase [Immundisolibacter sp.]
MSDRPRYARKIADPATLAARAAALARPLVFTNGCFDILHVGHVDYLDRAAALGASLVVGVNSDASVRRQGKGADRPINPLADRMAVLAALESVSLVVAFDEDTPLRLIERLRPEHLVKGGDWPVDAIVGADFVRALGGQVHSLPFRHQRSTSDLLRRIRAAD